MLIALVMHFNKGFNKGIVVKIQFS